MLIQTLFWFISNMLRGGTGNAPQTLRNIESILGPDFFLSWSRGK
jgi:hypothetical protein